MIGSVRLAEVANAINAVHRGTNVPFQSVSTDTRTIQSGDLFVALVGERFDGHAYINQAIEKGASAVMISRQIECDVPYLLVEDTTKGLARLAKFNRQRFEHPLVAVTGSSGKTTVKEMLAHVLRYSGDVLATRGNYNNHIGAPLTLLRLAEHQHYAVIELGASAEGEIDYTAQLAMPQVSILTNADAAHLEGFGDIDTVASTKGEIIDALNEDGTAILNADSPYFDAWVFRAGQRQVKSFGLSHGADVTAIDLKSDEHGRWAFKLKVNESEIAVKLSVMGRHNVINALAVVAACMALDIPMTTVVERIESFSGVQGRLVEKQGLNGGTVIDDSYNANPASVRAAIDVLSSRPGERILVLGDMAELGAETQRAHAEMGAYARESGVSSLFAIGEFSRSAVDAFGDNGHWFSTHASLVKYLTQQLNDHTTALVKGSRSARMDQVVKDITLEEKG